MATDGKATTQPTTDVETLHFFLGRLIERGEAELSFDEALSKFQCYLSELSDLKEKARKGIDSLDRGEGCSLDVEALISRVSARLAARGIAN